MDDLIDPGERKGAGYKRIRRLGSGSFGEVWLGEAPGGVEVAIKVIFRSLEHEEAQRELKALELIRRLHHPFLLQTQAYWIEQDRLHIAMELADGNLRDRAKKYKQAGSPGIPLRELLKYFQQAAEALDYLHDNDVLHRDIKPDNILLVAGYAKVADFGLARLREKQQSFAATSAGTLAYMPPEVWRGRIHLHSDQYSLAATFAELCLDRPLFPRDHIPLMYALDERIPDLAPLAPHVQQVLLKALSKKPSERFGSCLEFYQALEQAFAPGLTSPTTPGLGSNPAATTELEYAAGTTVEAPPTLPSGQIGKVPAPTRPDSVPARTDELMPAPPRRRWLPRAVLATAALVLCALAGFGLRTFLPRSPTPYLPPGCRPADSGAETVVIRRVQLYHRILLERAGTPPLPFILIRPSGDSGSAPFYIMENKVSNRLFAAFADAHPEEIKGSLWKKGGKNADWQDLGADQYPDFPVLRVTLLEAHRFAVWLGGEIPSAWQWDQAGGRSEDEVGPYRGRSDDLVPGKDIALMAEGAKRADVKPMPVGSAVRDVSIFGCHDMAGNGREWTRTLVTKEQRERLVDFARFDENQEVYLRGHSYRDFTPFQFSQHADTDSWYGGRARDDIGFRVVIELANVL